MVLIQPGHRCSDHPASLTHGCNQGQTKHPRPSEFTAFSGLSLNANGIRTNDGQKLDHVCHQLVHSTTNFFCLQETWLEGNYDPTDIAMPKGLTDSCLFLHHGQEKQSSCGSGGVAILLSALGKCAWESAGKPSPINGPLIARIACLIGIPLQYKDKRGEHIKVFLISVYFPDSGCHHNEFEDFLHTFLEMCNMASPNSIIVVTAEANVKLGWNLTLETEGEGLRNSQIAGPFSTHEDKNSRGMEAAHTLAIHLPTSAATWFWK
eukprot:7114565-Ditylum_brightwellii.AAC.1